MATQPKDAELAQTLKLVRALNAARGRLAPLAQVEPLDEAAWQMVLEMQKASYQEESPYPTGMAPSDYLKRAGFKAQQTPVDVRPRKKQGTFQSPDGLLRHVVKESLEDQAFSSAAHNKAYTLCGAACRNGNFVLILAG